MNRRRPRNGLDHLNGLRYQQVFTIERVEPNKIHGPIAQSFLPRHPTACALVVFQITELCDLAWHVILV